jgi:hypothetical protein
MRTQSEMLIDLETRFWNSMVEQDTETALEMLAQPAIMVSAHGAMQFDHADYRKMAEHGPMVVTAFQLSDMQVIFANDSTAMLTYRVKQEVAQRGESKGSVQEMNDTSTWVKAGDQWRCVMHTETPANGGPPAD